MATLKQIRQRIRTAKNIQQITRAMKLVSAARFRRAQDRALDARPYCHNMKELMLSIAESVELLDYPLLDRQRISHHSEQYAFVLITADRGLAGSYNTSLMKIASEFLDKQEGTPNLIYIGKKGLQFFSKHGYTSIKEFHLPSAGARFEDAVEVAEYLKSIYLSREVEEVYICYSEFHSAVKQVPMVVRLLPIGSPQGAGQSGVPSKEYIFQPNSKSVIEALLPKYFLTLVYQILLESSAGEHGARMAAMTSATDNALRMINQLTLKANRERQAAITKEILEVVGGAEALKS